MIGWVPEVLTRCHTEGSHVTFIKTYPYEPVRLGAMQPMIAWVPQALAPHDAALAPQAWQAPGHSMDEAPGLFSQALHGL